MKKLILKILLGLDVLAVAVYYFLAALLNKYDAVTGVVTDGFGRILTEAPLFLRSTGLLEKWPGLGWYLFDAACCLLLIGVAWILFVAITDKRGEQK